MGGRNRVPMAPLRHELERVGFVDVVTLLQSGNVVLTSEADQATVAGQVEEAVRATSGTVTRCVTIDALELDALRTAAILPADADLSRILVVAMDREPPPGAIEELASFDPGRTQLGGRCIVQDCPDGVSNSPALVPFTERRWGVTATARNFRMIERLVAAIG